MEMRFILSLVLSTLIVILFTSQWIIFEKAGKRGWYSLVPVYSTLVLLKIVGKPWWWIFLLLIPIINIVFSIWIINLISKSFGKNEGFTIGIIFLSFIFLPILAFGRTKYHGSAGSDSFDPANPPEILPIEYTLDGWVITIALYIFINYIIQYFILALFNYDIRRSSIPLLLLSAFILISAGLIKNKSWRIILIILGTIYLAIPLFRI